MYPVIAAFFAVNMAGFHRKGNIALNFCGE
jgi:hypothetical protein